MIADVTMKAIRETEQQIRELSERIKFLNESGGLQRMLNIGRLRNKKDELSKRQFYQIDGHLASEDREYQKIIEHNYDLLKTPKIHFTVYTNGFSFLGSYTRRIEGVINPNGYSYSYSARTNFAFLPFDSLRYPTEMKGKVDYWGKLSLKTTRTSYALFKSLPKRFMGYVDTNGYVRIENIENGWETASNGGMTIGKLIANHFEYDQYKNGQFQDNKAILSEKIHQFWDGIKAENRC